MTNATTLGSLYATYTKGQLDWITGGSAQYFGLDVTPDGRKLLLAGLAGKVFELEERPSLTISKSGANLHISWPASVSVRIIQSSPSLSADLIDLDPQPAVVVNDELNTVTIPLNAGNAFFRLRKP